jgi:hypothetical protein
LLHYFIMLYDFLMFCFTYASLVLFLFVLLKLILTFVFSFKHVCHCIFRRKHFSATLSCASSVLVPWVCINIKIYLFYQLKPIILAYFRNVP